MTCPYCQAAVENDARTCASCRRALVPSKAGPGALVASRYRLLEELGAGGMGVVFKAHDETLLDATVALKILRSDAGMGGLRSRFISEIKLARSVRHRNVCAIHDGGEDGELLYISMELVDGRDLKRILGENGPFLWEDGCDVAVQVALGLEAIHEAQVIHRDLKPANMLMDSKGLVRVMDFGIAKAWNADGPDHTKTGHIVGSPEYMSPEQIRGLPLDFRSDLYSFGVVLFEIFTGRVPFTGDTHVEVMAKHLSEPPPLESADTIPAGLVPILRRALAKSRDDRYASATEMRRDLEAARKAISIQKTDERKVLEQKVFPRPDVARLLIPQLLRAVGLPDPVVRRDAVLVLGTIGAEETIVRPYLEKARDDDDDPRVRDAAAQALRHLPPKASPSAPPAPGPEKHPQDSGAFETLPPPSPPAAQPPRPEPPEPPQPVPPSPRPQERSPRLLFGVAIGLGLLLALAVAWFAFGARRAAPRETAVPDLSSPPDRDAPKGEGVSPGQGPLPSPEEIPQPRPSAPSSVASVPSPPVSAAPTPRPSPVVGGTAVPSAAPPLVVTTTIPMAPSAEVLIPPESEPGEPRPPPPSSPTPTPSPSPARAGELVPLSDPDIRPQLPPGVLASPTPIQVRVGVTGTVDLSVLVDETGRVLVPQTEVGRVDCRPRGAQYEKILVDAALKNVAQWRFEPATRGGVPVRAWTKVQIRF